MPSSADTLTVDVEPDDLADGGGDAVLGDAHVLSHLAPGHLVQVELPPFNARG